MKQLHATDSPEWTRFFWAVIALSFLWILFGCERSASQLLAEHWYSWFLVTAGLFLWSRRFKKKSFPRLLLLYLAILFFAVGLAPYLLMFFFEISLNLLPL